MTGREKLEAALHPDGSREFGVTICYERLFYRDHWDELTRYPWWYLLDIDLSHVAAWHQDVTAYVGQDWLGLPSSSPRAERKARKIVVQRGQPFWMDCVSGEKTEIVRPRVGGWTPQAGNHSITPANPPMTRKAVEEIIADPQPFDAQTYATDGSLDLPAILLQTFRDRLPTGYVGSPFWACYELWGFEGLMILMAEHPDLVRYAAERKFAHSLESLKAQAARGVRWVWIEECFTDLIHPDVFLAYNLPLLKKLVDAIHQLGMQSVYYYTGNPGRRLNLLLESGTDVLGLEEGKKGFEIDIAQVADFVNGRCALLGNVDAIHCLETATDTDLRREIERQIAAGRSNKSRFILGIGSPVTPRTPADKVRRFLEMGRDLGAV